MRLFSPPFSKSQRRVLACVSFSIAAAIFFLPSAAARITGGNGIAPFANSGPIPTSENSGVEDWHASATVSDSPLSSQATLVVNDNGDAADSSIGNGVCDSSAAAGDQCTLRAAIQEANTLFGSDTITFSLSASSTITLNTALPEITGDLTITGPGSNQLTVMRSTAGETPNFRIFRINNGHVVLISGLTITNGRTADGLPAPGFGGQGDSGGGVFNLGTLTLSNMVITGNRTGDGGTGGSSTGGIGGFGGGVYSLGSLTMTNVTVSNNTTGNGATGFFGGGGGRGAGIYFSGTTLTMTDCVVSGNTAGNGTNGTSGGSSGNGGEGGGIEAENGTLTLTRVVINGNQAGDGATTISSTGGHGGGILTFPGVATTMTNCSVTNNNSGQGGSGFSPQGGLGGGIVNHGPMVMIGCTVSGNFTKGPSVGGGSSGGGIFNNNVLTMTNSTVSGNRTDLDVGRGGGIYNNGGTITLTNCIVTGNLTNQNSFETGRGIHNGGTANIKNTIIAGNGSGPDVSGNYNSQGNNLIGATNPDSTGFVNGSNGDQVGTTASPLDALLGPLANNGGFTQTHALLSGSPAFDAGNNALVTSPPFNGPPFTDQRGNGFNRIVDGPDANATATVDVGAYERQAVFPNLSDVSSNEDTTFTLGFEVTDGAPITSITATSSNTTLVPNNPANIVVTGTGSTRVLTIIPTSNLFGTSNITVTVNRTGGPESVTFTLTVNSVNDSPSFTKGADQSVNENSAAQTVNNWATNISPGPTNEAGQTLSFQVVSNSNPSLFSVAPAITASGTLTFTPAAGVSGSALITLALMDNGGTSNGGDDTSDTQTFNINVLEGGDLQFSGSFFSVGEGTGSILLTVVRLFGAAGEARVNYATSNGTATAGQDYVATSGTLIFPDGVTSQTFSITISNDTIDEFNETVNLTLSNAAGSGTLVQSNATVSIFDDDPQPSISIDDVSVTEGGSGTTNAVFSVTLSAASAFIVSAHFATADGSAVEPLDYLRTIGFVTFNPGEVTKTIGVTVNNDTVAEVNETFLVNLSTPTNSILADSQGVGTIISDDSPGGRLTFSSPEYNTSEYAPYTFVSVDRMGNTSTEITVDYTTSDGNASLVPCSTASGLASSRCDFTHRSGTLRFAPGVSGLAIPVFLNRDSFVEGPETLQIVLSNPTGGAELAQNGSTTTLTIADAVGDPGPNPVDSAEGFVRQHYNDFLNRPADPDGLAFWTNQIDSCGSDAQCIEIRRINVSAAFYLSIEFQETGYLVERMYKVAYGNALGTSTVGGLHQFPVPVVRLGEFLPDAQEISNGVVVGFSGWEQVLENNKQSFAARFVQRARFTNAFPTTMTESQFVDRLNTNAGGVLLPAERIQLITDLSAGTKTRAQVVRIIAEDSDLAAAERNRAFVLMQYFGYLRRNPNDSPDPNHTGYEFWLNKLNQFGGNFVNAEMVKAFIISAEYRQRFGP